MVEFTFDGQNINPNSNPIVANNANLYTLTFDDDDGFFGVDDQDDTVTIVDVTDPNNPITVFTDVSFTYIGTGVFPPNATPPEIVGREVAVVDILDANGNVVDSYFFFIDNGEQTAPLANGNSRLRRSDLNPDPEIICYAAGTRIMTPDGPRAVETIVEGDLIETASGPAKVIFTASHEVSGVEQMLNASLRAVVVKRGALGPDIPSCDLVLSQQHRVVLQGADVVLHFGVDKVLAPVKGLLDGERVVLSREMSATTYHHIALDRHDIVQAEGADVETLYIGDEAAKMLSAPDWSLLTRALAAEGASLTPKAALPFLSLQETRALWHKMTSRVAA